jgi:hypothetical protein
LAGIRAKLRMALLAQGNFAIVLRLSALDDSRP